MNSRILFDQIATIVDNITSPALDLLAAITL
jgi:hypothetical protein